LRDHCSSISGPRVEFDKPGPGFAAPASEPISGFLSLFDEPLLMELVGLAMSGGADFADVFVEDSIRVHSAIQDQILRQLISGTIQGVGIRAVKGQKTGYAHCAGFDPATLREMARTVARIGEGLTSFSIGFEIPRTPNYYPLQDPLAAHPIGEKVAVARKVDEILRGYDPKIVQATAMYTDGDRKILIATSKGVIVRDDQPLLRIDAVAVASDGQKRKQSVRAFGGRVGFEYLKTISLKDMVEDAARSAVVMLDAKPAPAGPMPVVLSNGWGGILLHEAVGHGLEADFIYKKSSLFTDKIGERVASDKVTVVDDATVPNHRGSINVDDEGNVGRRKVLIENGILRSYMVDEKSALMMESTPTASGRRESYMFPPIPRMTNTFMVGGESSFDEILAATKFGLYAKTFGGGQVDITNGNFVFEVREGYLIEDGKITAPVEGATLIGNGPQTLQNVDMVGDDFALCPGVGTCGKANQLVPVGVGEPSLRISEVTVGGTEV